MVIRKQFTARCRGCKQQIDLFNYEGLSKDSLMGSHHCAEISQFLQQHPRAWKTFENLREVPK
jgi:hypothetical protein